MKFNKSLNYTTTFHDRNDPILSAKCSQPQQQLHIGLNVKPSMVSTGSKDCNQITNTYQYFAKTTNIYTRRQPSQVTSSRFVKTLSTVQSIFIKGGLKIVSCKYSATTVLGGNKSFTGRHTRHRSQREGNATFLGAFFQESIMMPRLIRGSSKTNN
ncbi:hypothetical protein FF38_14554 [Lucilia cuprina]|uniref:Uncharacterized protein n=1 Tax=Lucilia cuprina TaxID=7375 RepID=A0A0L0CCV7_LUCCU|nr:hypothetical protein FF38_14554 [Lucilia cuprina]